MEEWRKLLLMLDAATPQMINRLYIVLFLLVIPNCITSGNSAKIDTVETSHGIYYQYGPKEVMRL